jgi:tetratricopeptide (TPR) repeat protein
MIMKQMSSETYNIAWFRLAECVSRGEKERALGVYRLLAHSIDDRAFAKQLEGDLYLSFNDKDVAQQKYRDAAHLYQQTGRIVEAAAIFEHLLTLDSSSEFYRTSVIDLYSQLGQLEKMAAHATKQKG